MMKNTRQELNNADKERLDKIIEPLKEKMDEFSKAVNDSNRDNTANKAEIKTAFEEAMKQLHNVQERTVRELKEQTERIGQGAEHLTQALKGDSKLQGDWGEMILERTLENCGLKKDDQYLIQPTYKDNEGKIMRPDAVVLFPNDESIIIDSKVSLTAYQEALNTSNDDEREKRLKEHITSVKKHIDELTDKNYEKIVPNSIGYVLMFIPYESGYAAAIKTDPGILQYAYKKKIIIISPANLLMTLQLTHTMWQNYRMNKNVEEIMRQSSDLYDKFVSYAETFVKMDKDIENLRTHFEQARNQLNSGKGNVIKRLENMKQLGVNPKKEIPENIKELN
jgi:DNA recombination protein RmuC